MSEVYALHVILPEFLSTRRALAVPISEILIDALLAEEVETSSQHNAFETVATYGAAQHPQGDLQHLGLILAKTLTDGAGRAACCRRRGNFALFRSRGLRLSLDIHPERRR